MVNGDRVRQARELRDLTQAALASRLNVNQSTAASIESGRHHPSPELALSIAIHTGFPLSFLNQDSPEDFPVGSHLLFRARASMSARQKAQVHRYAQTIFECSSKLSRRVTSISPRIPQLPSESPVMAADVTRSALGLSPDTPIADLLFSVEKAGVVILSLPISQPNIDAFSLWAGPNQEKPIISILPQMPGDRLRFSVAHELGHLVLHRTLKGEFPELEREANEFTGSFLLPEGPMREELDPPITLSTLAQLKPRWGVSIQSLIMRASELGILNERQKRYLFQQMSTRGIRKREPASLDIPLERPRGLRQMAELVCGVPIDYRRLSREVCLPETFLRETIECYREG